MEENFKAPRKIHPYFKWGGIVSIAIVVSGGGFLALKGPALLKDMAKVSLEHSLAPLGIQQVEIGSVRVGLGRMTLRDIHTKASSSDPGLSIQEINIALSLFFKMKSIEVVGATFELKDVAAASFSRDEWRTQAVHFGKAIQDIKRLKLPAMATHDCFVVFPSSQGPIKIPVYAVTETTATRNQTLAIDWGEEGENKFSGHLILEVGRKGTKIDFHTANTNITMPSFQMKAPEITFWGTTENETGEGCEMGGFLKLDHLALTSYGTLKTPLEVKLGGTGTPDNWVLDRLTIATPGSKDSLFELEGNIKPDQPSIQMVLTSQIPRLSQLWDFTPLLATYAGEKVFVDGQVVLASKVLWEKGRFTTSALALDIKGVSMAREGFSLEGGACHLTFTSLKPLITKGTQRLSAAKLSMAGIDLKNVLFDGLFNEKGFFQINQVTAKTLGGTLKAHRFQRLGGASHPVFQFESVFENIELAEILKLTDLSSLSGHAKLAGNASMRYGLKEGLDVLQAELHSISDAGLIQYKPENGSRETAPWDQKEVNMAFQVLDNLHFTLLNVRLEHAPDNPSEMQGIIKMLGSNPKVLNGYPFEFNIVTTGKLKDLVINTIQHMRPTADLNEFNKAIKATQEAKAAKTAKAAKSGKVTKRAKRTKRLKQKNRKLKDG